MKLQKKILLLLSMAFALVTASNLSAQNVVKGHVLDKEGQPVIGAAVLLKDNPNVGAIADMEGYFSINASATDVLVASALSFKTLEVPVSGRSIIEIRLEPDTETLEAVVLIGYGEQNAKDVTGAITTVDVSKVLSTPTTDFSQAMQGKVAGVVMSSNDGQPGEEMKVIIRGANSITGSNSPLYVIDGFPVEDFSSMSLNQDDIKSISILKDASAGAIYGSRGSNGVIIIETKSGDGKVKINYSGSVSVQQATHLLDVMDPYNFVKYVDELGPGYADIYLKDQGMTLDDYREIKGNDWQSMIFHLAPMHTHSLNISGGTSSTKYAISGSYNGQDGIVVNTGYQKAQARVKLEQKLFKTLTAKFNVNYTWDKTHGAIAAEAGSSSSSWQTYLMYRVYSCSPLRQAVLDEEDEDTVIDVTQLNPVISAKHAMRDKIKNYLFASGALEWQIIPDLKFTTSFAYNLNSTHQYRFNDSKTYAGFKHVNNVNGVNGSYESDLRREMINENTLNYKKKFNKNHVLTAMASFTIQDYKRDNYYLYTTNITNEDMGYTAIETGIPRSTKSRSYQNRTMSALARINYSAFSRYLFTVSFRADGCSKFPKNNRWGYFPSAAVGWRFNEEPWLKGASSWLSEGKIRASFGITGNNKVSDYAFYQTIDYVDHYPLGETTPAIATGLSTLENKSLTWEKTRQIDLGLDLGLFHDRVRLNLDLYDKYTTDLLLNAYVPYSTGLATAYLNIGSVRNQGLEITLNTVNVDTYHFRWTSSFNIAFNKNNVVSLSGEQNKFTSIPNFTGDFNATPLYLTQIGAPITSFYGLIWEGNYQLEDFNVSPGGTYTLKPGIPDNGNDRATIQPGDIKYADQNGDGTITSEDMVVIGRAFPIHTGGFTNEFSCHGFTLSVFLQWSYGNHIMNANRIALEGNFAGRTINQLASYNDRYNVNDPSTYDSPNYRTGGFGPRGFYSTRTLEDGSYLRIKDITLSYDFSQKLLKKTPLTHFQLFLSCKNAYTFTRYSGNDPEVSLYNSILTPGFDYSAYPRARVYTFGLKFGF